MGRHARAPFLGLSLTLGLGVIANSQAHVPAIWNDRALEDWATPLASLKIRPAHYTAAEYYSAPSDNLRTYPVYLPDKEPPGYWEDLQKKKPEPLVDVSKIRTTQDWIVAGARAFGDLDKPLARTNDPALIAKARDPKTFANVRGLADGTVREIGCRAGGSTTRSTTEHQNAPPSASGDAARRAWIGRHRHPLDRLGGPVHPGGRPSRTAARHRTYRFSTVSYLAIDRRRACLRGQ